MTVDALLDAAKQLTPHDRIRLVEEVWDSVAVDAPEAAALSPEQEAELNRRLDRIERDGLQGVAWEDLKRELTDGAGR